MRGRGHCGEPGVDEDNFKMDFQELDVGVWPGWSWLRVGTGGRHL